MSKSIYDAENDVLIPLAGMPDALLDAKLDAEDFVPFRFGIVGDTYGYYKNGSSVLTPFDDVQSPIHLDDVVGATLSCTHKTVTLTWTDPDDYVLSEVTLLKWAGTKVVRKKGSAPQSYTDGTVIVDNKVKNQYASSGYVDTAAYDGVYYYRFFPYDESGVYTTGTTVSCTPAREIIQTEPGQQIGTLTYDGTLKTATFENVDNKYTVTNNTATNAGSYTATITPTDDYTWSDGSQTSVERSWSIEKGTGTATLSSDSVTLDSENLTATVNVTNPTGTVTVSSSDTEVATVAYENGVITITATEESGEATISVNIASSDNYESAVLSIDVEASFVKLVSWSSGTDDEIAAMVDAYYDGKFSLNDVKSVWAVGDTRNINLSAMAATGVGESHRAQTVTIQILDFDHDTLTTPINGKTKALITVDLKNCLRDATVSDTGGSSNTENGYMNSTASNVGGWTSSARRIWCNNTFYSALPSTIKSKVKPVNKLTSAGNQSSTINTTSDKCFLLSEIEIFGTVSRSKSGEGTQYAHYTTASNRYKLPKWTSSGSSDNWWERSPNGSNTTNFCFVGYNGAAGSNVASYGYGLAPAFAL